MNKANAGIMLAVDSRRVVPQGRRTVRRRVVDAHEICRDAHLPSWGLSTGIC